jgi:hypothetical protein
MATAHDHDVAQTEEEAKKRNYKPYHGSLEGLTKFELDHRGREALLPGALCLKSNCRPDNTMIVCYWDGISCTRCYTTSCIY